jgi:Raf kinase inhibitor-like YbhB/YbcL family protein
MKLSSSEFENGENIPKKYTCEGDNVNPPLIISEIPGGTKSLALIMYDPDIPQEFKEKMNINGWDHWVVWNILPETKNIPENSQDLGTQGMQTGGKKGYTGPCPPKDKEPPKHRYFFWLFALDVENLELEEGKTTKVQLEKAMEGHIIDNAELLGYYEKTK